MKTTNKRKLEKYQYFLQVTLKIETQLKKSLNTMKTKQKNQYKRYL
ncbi:unnamed protein product [Paramecium sonneborni]|uniref:Uncharacterized protein n=1 Tax=Paramecium sonneborni TaxID=65129 RepID=A0A8S1JZQ1_9CILI|nr:unnamed protein product [Paramecium sonneborni]